MADGQDDDVQISEIQELSESYSGLQYVVTDPTKQWPWGSTLAVNEIVDLVRAVPELLARLNALAAEAADVARENEALIEEVKAAGEQIAALAAERDDWRARPGRRGAMASERCDHSVRDAAMGGAIGLGLLAAGLGAPWAVAGMVAGGLLGWWLARRPAAQEGRDASE